MKRIFITTVLALAILLMPLGSRPADALDRSEFRDVIIGFEDDAGDRLDLVERMGG